MNYSEQIKAVDKEIKSEKAYRKMYAAGLTRSDERIRKNAEELVAMQDETIAKLTAKRENLAKAATRGILE